jgi:cobalamin biosynthesis Co2+ chelatase CbiK
MPLKPVPAGSGPPASPAGSPSTGNELLRPAVILVCRGAADPEDLQDILSVEKRIAGAFPCYDPRIAFSSDALRSLWRERAEDPGFRAEHPDTDPRIYGIKNLISELAAVQETGPRLTLVQGLQLIDGPDHHDLKILVETLRQIKNFDRAAAPFPWIGLGEPALGIGEGRMSSLFKAAEALAPAVREAEAAGAGLLFVSDPLGGLNPAVHRNLETALKSANKDVPLGVAIHESRQSGRDILNAFAKGPLPPPGPVMIATLAPVAGDEVRRDIEGPHEDSWASVCRSQGYDALFSLQGLGSNPLFADILVENLKSQEDALSRRYID